MADFSATTTGWGTLSQSRGITISGGSTLPTPTYSSKLRRRPTIEVLETRQVLAAPTDFDNNGVTQVTDLEALAAEVRAGTHQPQFDLTGDGLVDRADVDHYLRITGAMRGDADLDGDVDFADFVKLASAFGKPGDWSGGDFDLNGTVTFADFIALAQAFGKTGAFVRNFQLIHDFDMSPVGEFSTEEAVVGIFGEANPCSTVVVDGISTTASENGSFEVRGVGLNLGLNQIQISAETVIGVRSEQTLTIERASPLEILPSTADTFAVLNSASDIVDVNEANRTQRYESIAATDRVFDARNASFLISDTTHGIITMKGDASQTGMYWAGGYVSGDRPWNASWDDWKYGPQTRNSTVINNDATSATVTGMHFFNVHDGPRISRNATDWTVQHVWGEYVRDDCIENDHLRSGKVVDSLFDGCYTGISTRPDSSDTSGKGEVVTLDGVLLRLEASPYPFKYETKQGIIDANGDPWDGTEVPYGHGNLFKYINDDIDRNVHFVIKNSVFLLPHDNVTKQKLSFPPEELIDELSNVTVIWLGSGSFPGDLSTSKFPDGVTVLTGQAGLDYWKEKVTDWHQRHPDVDPARKPADPGTIVFPRIF